MGPTTRPVGRIAHNPKFLDREVVGSRAGYGRLGSYDVFLRRNAGIG